MSLTRIEDREELLGRRFGKLTVVEYKRSKNKLNYICKCDCGNTRVFGYGRLMSGHNSSCGCMTLMHGDKPMVNKFGLHATQPKLCNVLLAMLSRCEKETDKAYKYYGARGIKVCDEWHDREKFVKWALENGYEEGLTIDRIDVNGNYEPNNCRWITQQEQLYNTRRTRYYCYKGERLTSKEISDRYGIKQSTLNSRVNDLGWSVERAIETPLMKKFINERFKKCI